jgi:hypothetical protein
MDQRFTQQIHELTTKLQNQETILKEITKAQFINFKEKNQRTEPI